MQDEFDIVKTCFPSSQVIPATVIKLTETANGQYLLLIELGHEKRFLKMVFKSQCGHKWQTIHKPQRCMNIHLICQIYSLHK